MRAAMPYLQISIVAPTQFRRLLIGEPMLATELRPPPVSENAFSWAPPLASQNWATPPEKIPGTPWASTNFYPKLGPWRPCLSLVRI